MTIEYPDFFRVVVSQRESIIRRDQKVGPTISGWRRIAQFSLALMNMRMWMLLRSLHSVHPSLGTTKVPFPREFQDLDTLDKF